MPWPENEDFYASVADVFMWTGTREAAVASCQRRAWDTILNTTVFISNRNRSDDNLISHVARTQHERVLSTCLEHPASGVALFTT